MDVYNKRERQAGCLTLLVLILVVIFSVSVLITSSEAIPDRAKFVYDMNLKVIIPCPESGKPIFFPVPGKHRDQTGNRLNQWDGITSWAELKRKDGPFSEYNLPNAPGWNNFVFYGKPIPLWRDLLLKPESRWDEKGYWRY